MPTFPRLATLNLNHLNMQSEGYRECLEEALENLATVNQSIFDTMIPLLMSGEMKDWSAEVPIGEVHNFDWELFKNSGDTNIQLLVKVMETVDQAYNSIKNINGINTDDEE